MTTPLFVGPTPSAVVSFYPEGVQIFVSKGEIQDTMRKLLVHGIPDEIRAWFEQQLAPLRRAATIDHLVTVARGMGAAESRAGVRPQTADELLKNIGFVRPADVAQGNAEAARIVDEYRFAFGLVPNRAADGVGSQVLGCMTRALGRADAAAGVDRKKINEIAQALNINLFELGRGRLSIAAEMRKAYDEGYHAERAASQAEPGSPNPEPASEDHQEPGSEAAAIEPASE